MKPYIALLAGVLLAALLTACQPPAQQSGPDPEPDIIKPVVVIAGYKLPNGFRNVIEFCDNYGYLIAVTSRGSDLAGGQNGGGLPSTITMVKDPVCAK